MKQMGQFIFTKNRSAVQAVMIIVAISIFAGCSSTGKNPTGASARAEKGLLNDGGNGGNNGGIDNVDPFLDSSRPTGTFIPIDQKAREMGITNLCARIHFDLDKSEIKPEFMTCLDNVAAFLSANPSINVVIEGHCDERGTQEYNLALGEKRAMTTMSYLTAKGVGASRFTIRSQGEEKPVELGSNESAWSQNRRAEFYAVQ
jgi:peptidoglycan-associated lipoprotein